MSNIHDTTDALIRWCDDRGPEAGVDDMITHFSETNGQYLLPAVLRELEARMQEAAFYNQLHITTAREERSSTDLLKSAFGQNDASGMVVKSDSALLAGAACEYRGIQIKDNLHGRLQALHNRLNK